MASRVAIGRTGSRGDYNFGSGSDQTVGNRLADSFGPSVTSMVRCNPQERLRLLRYVLIEDITFSNPDDQDHGIERLAATIADFQQSTPGGYFLNMLLRQQHGQLLVAWTLFDRNDVPLVNGHSYGTFDEDTAQITRLVGFWKL